jgi:hypothetical protein
VSRATLYRLFGFEGGVMAYIAGRRASRGAIAKRLRNERLKCASLVNPLR